VLYYDLCPYFCTHPSVLKGFYFTGIKERFKDEVVFLRHNDYYPYNADTYRKTITKSLINDILVLTVLMSLHETDLVYRIFYLKHTRDSIMLETGLVGRLIVAIRECRTTNDDGVELDEKSTFQIVISCT
jgi:hypothetical protein